MGFLSEEKIHELKSKYTSDPSFLGKIYRSKKDKYQRRTIEHSMLEAFVNEGWEEDAFSRLKTKVKIRKLKEHSRLFEDEIWCQLYELGFRTLNIDENFSLPFSDSENDSKQIDVIAVNNDTIILVECKSSEHPKKANSFREEIDALSLRMDGFRKSLRHLFGEDKKVKFIFATRNLRIAKDSEDLKRLEKIKSYYYNENTYDYVNNLISKYKNAALYQFQGLLFRQQLINSKTIDVPALKGSMGDKEYYVFSLEPSTLLKLGFVLHRTRANEAEFPTYQRLLVPSRLGGITKFIDNGGFFPNSVIINFNSGKNRLHFEASSKIGDTRSKAGILRIPNAYAIAYIIDGQHRIYGYANSKFKDSNTIPVVAFNNLETEEQLQIFMDVNQNQKAVSPSLRLDLEEDLYWNSNKADSRIKALKSSIIKVIANEPSSVLYRKISVGEDTSTLTFKPFYSALTTSGLLPSVRGNKYIGDDVEFSMYNTENLDHSKEMKRAKKDIANFIMLAYDFVATKYPILMQDENSLIFSNRGTFAFISLLGSLNKHAIKSKAIVRNVDVSSRFDSIQKYIVVLLDKLIKLSDEEKISFLEKLGAGADTEWLRRFQTIINVELSDYDPIELVDWQQRQDLELQEIGRRLAVDIESTMKKIILSNLKTLFGQNWDLEIGSIKRDCINRAEESKEKNYKEGLGIQDVEWTDMFDINDYKSIISKFWSKSPEGYIADGDFKTFANIFAIDIGEEFNSKSDKLKWISYLNKYRNEWAHEGTKGRGLNKKEVDFLKYISSILTP